MSSVTVSGISTLNLPAGGTYSGTIDLAGNNTEDGLVTSAVAALTWSRNGVTQSENIFKWGSVNCGVNYSSPPASNVYPDVFTQPQTSGKPADTSSYFNSSEVFPDGDIAFSLSIQFNYTRVRLDAIDPAVLDPAGGQLVTLSGAGFLGAVVNLWRASSPSVPAGTATLSVFSIQIGGVDATDVTVIDDNHITFVSPPNDAAPPDTYALQLFYESSLSPGSASIGFPIWEPALFVPYGGAAATWWFNPTSGHYRYAVESPGAPFVASDAPTPTVTSFSPRSEASAPARARMIARAAPRTRPLQVRTAPTAAPMFPKRVVWP